METLLQYRATYDFARAAGAAVATALATHQLVKRREPQPFGFIASVTAGTVVTSFALAHVSQLHPVLAIGEALKLTGIFLAALLGSIAVYRLSPWHPLASYPGPLLCKLTQLYWVSFNYTGSARHVLEKWHASYGLAVRIGPNELSIADADAIFPIHGTNGFIKAKNYTGGPSAEKNEEDGSLARLRTRAIHQERRKHWNPGFGAASLLEYQPCVYKGAQQLMDLYARTAGKPVDIHDFSGLFTFQVVMELAYGSEAFEEGKTPLQIGYDKDRVINEIVQAVREALRFDTIPWLRDLLGAIVGASQELQRMGAYTHQRFIKRYKEGSKSKDAFGYLLEPDPVTGKRLNATQLANDSFLIILGGSDTTSTSYTLILMFMIAHPEWYKKLQAELDDMFESTPASAAELSSCKTLDAVINESMRLLAALPSGLPRVAPAGGQLVGGKYYIPEDTTVRNPSYIISRDPNNFSPAPKEYRPERWLHPEKEERFNRTAFIPFSIGPYVCIGKALALQELRTAVAWTVMRFNAKFAEGFDPKKYFYEGFRDSFILCMDWPVPVVFEERKDVIHSYPTW